MTIEQAYRQEVIKRTPGGGGLNSDLHSLFDSLAGGDSATDAGNALKPSIYIWSSQGHRSDPLCNARYDRTEQFHHRNHHGN